MSPTRQRASKACNNCRARRIRCTGGVPCTACQDADLADRCTIRVKARPQRPISSKILAAMTSSASDTSTERPRRSISPQNNLPHPTLSPFPPDDRPIVDPSSSTSSLKRQTLPIPNLQPAFPVASSSSHDGEADPAGISTMSISSENGEVLAAIEESLLVWSLEQGISLDSLCYQDEACMTLAHATPLPTLPYLIEFEDNLMRSLAHNHADANFNPLGEYDQLRVFNLYGRHRILPSSLTDDQKALVFASLCVAKHIQMKRYVSTGTPGPESFSREDLTYFNMACDALAAWNRPSIHAMWALYCLAPVTQAHGGMGESRRMMQQLAWQAKQLGLNKGLFRQLYPPQDMVQILFATFHYQDAFSASLSNLRLLIPLTEIDVDCTMSKMKTPDLLYQASCHTAAFIQACMDPSIDTATDDFVNAAETLWAPTISALRHEPGASGSVVTLTWATSRYHWMRILMYYPRTRLDPARASQAWMILARSTANLIHVHSALHQIGHLNPSWPQMKKFSHLGQVLILCILNGEILKAEGEMLFEHLLRMISAHDSLFQHAHQMVIGYTKAGQALGLSLPETTDPAVDTSNALFVGPGDPSWGLFGSAFDPLFLFNTATSNAMNESSWSL